MVVSWEPPPPEAHNGVIRGYQVRGNGERGQGWSLLAHGGQSKGIYPKRSLSKVGEVYPRGEPSKESIQEVSQHGGSSKRANQGGVPSQGICLVASKGVYPKESSLGDFAKVVHPKGDPSMGVHPRSIHPRRSILVACKGAHPKGSFQGESTKEMHLRGPIQVNLSVGDPSRDINLKGSIQGVHPQGGHQG